MVVDLAVKVVEGVIERAQYMIVTVVGDDDRYLERQSSVGYIYMYICKTLLAVVGVG